MSLLAETNKAGAGRWVLMPQKGRRFLGPRDRQRMRLRRRRRHVFVALVEAIALTLLMGLFPPFRGMLYGTAILTGFLIVYTALLVRVRAEEVTVDRRYQARERAAAGAAYGNGRYSAAPAGAGYGYGYEYASRYESPTRYGNGASNGNGGGNGYGYGEGAHSRKGRVGRNGNSYGREYGTAREPGPFDDGFFPEDGIQIIDDDVHVILRRSDEVDVEALRAGASSTD